MYSRRGVGGQTGQPIEIKVKMRVTLELPTFSSHALVLCLLSYGCYYCCCYFSSRFTRAHNMHYPCPTPLT